MSKEREQTRGIVLVIDDDHAFSRRLDGLLMALNLSVYRDRTAQEALERLESLEPDLILLDMILPDSSGLSLLRRLRTSEEHRGRQVVITSGLVMSGDRKQAMAAGASAFLPKPYSLTDLQDVLPTAIGAQLLTAA